MPDGVVPMFNDHTAAQLVATAADAIVASADSFHELLDGLPAPIYVTDAEGTITYFNQACVELAGRRPQVGIDKWCVTFKLYTPEGEPLPHDECPMAIAIREQRSIRDVEAVAERPDGSQINFVPFPTPLFDQAGNFAGAVNLLMDVTEERKPEYLRAQAERCRRLAAEISDRQTSESLWLMAAKYDEQSLRFTR
jgi:PAS domain S-box-containing protein